MSADASFSIYDGRHVIGRVAMAGRKHLATALPSGRRLGSFRTRQEAIAAINAEYARQNRDARQSAKESARRYTPADLLGAG